MSYQEHRPRILITGKNGRVGWELVRALAPLGEIVPVGAKECDFQKSDDIVKLLRDTRPNLIVNSAAYTAVDQAEKEEKKARQINAIAPEVIACEARRLGAFLIHFSTDYVFDGQKETPYFEGDEPNPQSVYGKTKLDGEIAVSASGARHAIFRLAWVYGSRGQNFLLNMLKKARDQEEIKIVADQFGVPSWNRMVAKKICTIVNDLLSKKEFEPGIFHLSEAGKTTWYEFARKIFASAKKNNLLAQEPSFLPVSSDNYVTAARRPKNSVLDGSKVERLFGITPAPWDIGVERCIQDIASSKPGYK